MGDPRVIDDPAHCDAAAGDTATGRSVTIAEGPWTEGRAVLWRGFEHRWLRTVLGFATPHRISRLASFIGDQEAPAFTFAQAAGVDGNFMRPIGHWAELRAPGLLSRTVRHRWRFTDAIVEDAQGTPSAATDLSDTLSIPLPEPLRSQPVVALLGGFAIRSWCEPERQPDDCPCNSNGFWPHELGFSVGAATATEAGLEVPVSLRLHRSWTPNLGGLPPVEIKPLNRHLDYEVDVYVTLLSAPELSLTGLDAPTLRGPARATEALGDRLDAPMGAGLAGLQRWSLSLPVTGDKPKHRHRGRYLGGLTFAVEEPEPDVVARRAQVWVPRTVIAVDTTLELGAAWLEVGGDAVVRRNERTEGRLCFNSTEQAPFFSRWQGCNDPDKGPACSEMSVALPVTGV